MDTSLLFKTPEQRPGHRKARSMGDFEALRRPRAQRFTVFTAAIDEEEGEGLADSQPEAALGPPPALIEPVRSPRARQQSSEERRSLHLLAAAGSYRQRRNSQSEENGLLPSAPLKSPRWSPPLFKSPAERGHLRRATEPGRILFADKPHNSLAPRPPSLDEIVAWRQKRVEQKQAPVIEEPLLTPALASTIDRAAMRTPENPPEQLSRSVSPVSRSPVSRDACTRRMLATLAKRVTLSDAPQIAVV